MSGRNSHACERMPQARWNTAAPPSRCLTGQPPLWTSAAAALGKGLVLQGDLQAAETILSEARALTEGGTITRRLIDNLFADIAVLRGDRDEAARIYERVLEQGGDRPLWQVVEARIGLAGVWLSRDDLVQAEQFVRAAIDLAQRTERDIFLARAYLTLAQIHRASGDGDAARETVTRAKATAERLGNPRAVGEADQLLHALSDAVRQSASSRRRASANQTDVSALAEPLSEREQDVLSLLIAGCSNRKSPRSSSSVLALSRRTSSTSTTNSTFTVAHRRWREHGNSGSSNAALPECAFPFHHNTDGHHLPNRGCVDTTEARCKSSIGETRNAVPLPRLISSTVVGPATESEDGSGGGCGCGCRDGLALVFGWPNDWARRRAPRLIGDLTTLANVAGLTLGIVCLVPFLHGGIGTVVSLVLGTLPGSTIGDRRRTGGSGWSH